MPQQPVPKYRRQKRAGKSDLAFVEIDGSRLYLGVYDTPESRQKYKAAIAEWETSGFTSATGSEADLRVDELVDRYWQHAKVYYRKPDGTPTSEQDLIKRALAVLVSLYGELPAKDFSPLKLKAVRSQMMAKGWCRKVVNGMVHRVRRAFGWAVENEMIPATVCYAIKEVKGLAKGRSEAPESEPVTSAPEHLVEPIMAHLSPQVVGMIRLQLLTGARPGEICQLRTCDLDMKGELWLYRPDSHKTEHHGHERLIYIGPKAQELLRPFIRLDTHAYIFSPAEADAWRRERAHKKRKTPAHYGNAIGTNRKANPKRSPGNRYDVDAYRHAICRACDATFPPAAPLAKQKGESTKEWKARLTPEQKAELKKWREDHRWHPHQLRHTAATRLRHEHGLEAAQVILGHKTLTVTQVYAEKNVAKAKETMRAVG